MPSYTLAAVIRVFSWISLGVALWLADSPLLLLGLFFLFYTLARLAAGLGGLGFFEVVAKTIPADRRGSFFAWRMLAGGLLGLGAGWVTRAVLEQFPFPHGHAVLFFLYCLVATPAMVAFILIREPPGTAVPRTASLREQLRRASSFLRSDPIFRRYMGYGPRWGWRGLPCRSMASMPETSCGP